MRYVCFQTRVRSAGVGWVRVRSGEAASGRVAGGKVWEEGVVVVVVAGVVVVVGEGGLLEPILVDFEFGRPWFVWFDWFCV
jgi:hypothetical protein